MASLAKASSDPVELNKFGDLDSAKIAKSDDHHKVVEFPGKPVETPKNMGLGAEFTDTLISTEVDPLPWKSSNLGISYPGGEEKSPVSYSSDLIGLDMAAGSSLLAASDHDRETIHLPRPNFAITPINQTLDEVVAYLSGNLSVIRQALELEMWPQLDAIINRLQAKTEETKALFVKLPQEPLLSNGGLSSDKTTDTLTRVSEKAATSCTKYSRDDPVVLQSHGLNEDILASVKASDSLSERDAPAGPTEVSKLDLGLTAESEERAGSKQTMIMQDLPAGRPEDISVSKNPVNAVASHRELEEALAAPTNVLAATAEIEGREVDSIVPADRPELDSGREATVEAQPGLVVKHGSLEGEGDDQDPISPCGAPEQTPNPHDEHEGPIEILSPSSGTIVVPQFDTQQIQVVAPEEDQPLSQPNSNASRPSSFSGQINSNSIFGTHLMPGQAGRELPLSHEHSIASPPSGARPLTEISLNYS